MDRQLIAKEKVAMESPGLVKSKAKGVINFPPFEDLDEVSLREVQRFGVFPFGSIQESCKHIPYNSGKKDFYEKTGRESFEVFQYCFKVPGDDSEYSVMWDYNVGLVRMTSFFKCCKYGKTIPAKMLNMNPGLRDITHSITGGSIQAQGYWMPFSCAKAVCATFCHHIAGALIPIFGPGFPAECIPPDAAKNGQMVINPAIITEAAHEAEMYRQMFVLNHHQHALPSGMGRPSPKPPRRSMRLPLHDYEYEYSRNHYKKGTIMGSPYGYDSESDIHSAPELSYNPHSHLMYRTVPQARTTTAQWSPTNPLLPPYTRDVSFNTNPMLSAMPSLEPARLPHLPRMQTATWHHPKRSAPDVDSHYEYDTGESQGSTSPPTTSRGDVVEGESPTSTESAAMALMHLSEIGDEGSSDVGSPTEWGRHRSKRRRPASM